eukprot:scaffold85583_cov41-Prasinocladus_malaysianus.AAC.1
MNLVSHLEFRATAWPAFVHMDSYDLWLTRRQIVTERPGTLRTTLELRCRHEIKAEISKR